MKLTPQLIEKEIKFFFHGDNKRKAEIVFQFVNQTGLKNEGVWDFRECRFVPERVFYTLSDWDFLSAINSKIIELNKSLNKTK